MTQIDPGTLFAVVAVLMTISFVLGALTVIEVRKNK